MNKGKKQYNWNHEKKWIILVKYVTFPNFAPGNTFSYGYVHSSKCGINIFFQKMSLLLWRSLLPPVLGSGLDHLGSGPWGGGGGGGVLWRSVTLKFVYFKSLCVFCFLFYFVTFCHFEVCLFQISLCFLFPVLFCSLTVLVCGFSFSGVSLPVLVIVSPSFLMCCTCG